MESIVVGLGVKKVGEQKEKREKTVDRSTMI